jgi:outer membrane protein OmpA-like peptidoglycan-associated protein
MLLAVIFSLSAMAQQPLTWEIRHGSADGSSRPALIVTTHLATTSMDIEVSCDGQSQTHHGGTRAGQAIRLEFKLAPGTHSCQGSLQGSFQDGSEGQAPLRFELKAPRALSLSYTKSDLDLLARTMAVSSSHPIDRIEVQVFGPGGTSIASGIAPADPGSLGPHRLQWTPTEAEVVQIRLIAHGTLGEAFSLDLWPWSYRVPHEDLNFTSGSHEVTPTEAHKLTPAMAKIASVLTKYGRGVGGQTIPIHLYVAGYTDTVGSAGSNRALSERRARSIARWFRANGFDKPIYIQGFGEQGLIRPTADEVDDPANRRALYMLSATPPSTSTLIPGTSWKLLN